MQFTDFTSEDFRVIMLRILHLVGVSNQQQNHLVLPLQLPGMTANLWRAEVESKIFKKVAAKTLKAS